jgi:hypothetical protein
MTELAEFIDQTRLMDTHEHLRKESDYVEKGPDVLQDLFQNYVESDLQVAGATPEALKKLFDSSDPDLSLRFQGVSKAWECCRHTGYGEAVRLMARHVYDMEEITPESLEKAKERNRELRKPGQRLRILRDVARLDHVQVDDFSQACIPDESGLDFFLYDISWRSFCFGEVAWMQREVGQEIGDLKTLRDVMAGIFARYAPFAIALKSQHAYHRTLQWRERSDEEAAQALQRQLSGKICAEEDRMCLGDWCWERGVELSIQYNLPFKLHTGYYVGQGYMQTERIRAGHLCGLLQKYPKARFVLMHLAYPYSMELVALAKHFTNVHVDLCWAWSIDPYSAADSVRRMIHAVPANKLFAFGGDTSWPNAVLAYSIQARAWMTRTLQAEIDERLMTEKEAIRLAQRMMRTNQEEFFDLKGTRERVRARAEAGVPV